jgi:hypothetical protein
MARAHSQTAGELAAMLARLFVVLGIVYLGLRCLDWLPRLLGGEPRGILRFDTISDLERRTGERVLLPPYFPDSIRWPPRSIRLFVGPPECVALAFLDRGGTEERLAIYQTAKDDSPIPGELRPRGIVLESTEIPFGGLRATLSRISLDDGRLVHEVTWLSHGRRHAVTFRGPVEDLLKLAGSVERTRR